MSSFDEELLNPNLGATEVSRIRVGHTFQVKDYTSMTFDATISVPNYTQDDGGHIVESIINEVHSAYGRVFLHFMKRYDRLNSDEAVKAYLLKAIPLAIRTGVLNNPILMDCLLVAAEAEMIEEERLGRFKEEDS